MPRYGVINERKNQLHEVKRLSGINIIVNDADYPLIIKVATLPETRLQVYFVDNEEFFRRKSLFGTDTKYQNSHSERSAFFVRAALEAIRKLHWVPDVVHCFGWFSALAPLYLRTIYKDDPCLGRSKVIFSAMPEETEAAVGDNLQELLAFDKVPDEALEALHGEYTPEALRRVAVTHADGLSLIAGDEKHPLASHAAAHGTQLLLSPESDWEMLEAYEAFLDRL